LTPQEPLSSTHIPCMGEVISRQNGGTSSHDCMGSNASKNVREQDPRPSPIPLPSTTTVPAGLQFSLEKDAVYKENVVYGKLKFKIKGLGSWLGPGHVKNVSQCPQGQRVIWPPPSSLLQQDGRVPDSGASGLQACGRGSKTSRVLEARLKTCLSGTRP
jgi:hypothetical protein